MIKMIVTDLDGTLLDSEGKLSIYTKAIINNLKINNILFVIATARPPRALSKLICDVNFDYAICHNGVLILDKKNKSLDNYYYGIIQAKKIIDKLLKEKNYRIAVENNGKIYSNFNTKIFWENEGYILTDFNFLEDKFCADKIIIAIDEPSDMEDIKRSLGSEYDYKISENKIIMIMNKRATKYNALKKIMEIEKLNESEIVAFGDDYNDIEMIAKAGTGVAVNNAISDLKKISDYICLDNNLDGVAKWIESKILKGATYE